MRPGERTDLSLSEPARLGRAFIPQSCQMGSDGSGGNCRLVIDPPPKTPDPWIYDPSAGQAQQFSSWQANPGGGQPPTFWIPDAAWQLAAPAVGPLGSYVVAPGQSVLPSFQLTVPPNVDGGTFLAPLATVAGITANGTFVGGLTVVAAVND